MYILILLYTHQIDKTVTSPFDVQFRLSYKKIRKVQCVKEEYRFFLLLFVFANLNCIIIQRLHSCVYKVIRVSFGFLLYIYMLHAL